MSPMGTPEIPVEGTPMGSYMSGTGSFPPFPDILFPGISPEKITPSEIFRCGKSLLQNNSGIRESSQISSA